jgi:hypothetical protein
MIQTVLFFFCGAGTASGEGARGAAKWGAGGTYGSTEGGQGPDADADADTETGGRRGDGNVQILCPRAALDVLDLLERCMADTCGEAPPSTIMLQPLLPPKDAAGETAAYVVAGE